MRKVAIVGVGITNFGVFPERSIKVLSEEACWEAIQDARINPKRVEVAYCGNMLAGIVGKQGGIVGQLALKEVGIIGIPITRVENACASSSFALREAYMAIAGGFYDLALVIGIEKMSEKSTEDVTKALAGGSDVELEGGIGLTFPGVFAMIATRHMYEYGTTREQLAKVSVKNHKNGSLNPNAHFQKEITLDQVLNSPMISYPLTLFDCCPMSDGCAVAILASEDIAKKITDSPIWVAASVVKTGTYLSQSNITTFDITVKTAQEAYETSGIGPKDIDFAEVHDCFTIAEIIHSEDLGFCKKGEGGLLVESGDTKIGGRIPISVSGGLKAKGHPVGATGVAQIVEIVKQLRGEGGKRQLKKARVGLAHCMGGFTHGDGASVAIHILKK